MKNTWKVSGSEYYQSEVTANVDLLPVGIYNVEVNSMTGDCYLNKVAEKFEFPYKIYGTEDAFIERVVTTYGLQSKNLGVLLSGLKGTGKTVCAKQTCNKLNLPIITVNVNPASLPNFINSIQQECILFFDEYEKNFRNDHHLLGVMDGVFDNGFKKVFLLTTNDLYINENMLNRPSRIRYKKEFSDLSIEVITEIVDDLLVHKELKDECIKYISTRENITIDIVKCVLEEVNYYKESPYAFEKILNVNKKVHNWTIYKVVEGKKVFFAESKTDYDYEPGDSFYLKGEYLGDIEEVSSDNEIVVNHIIDDGGNTSLTTFIFEPVETIHRTFRNYTF